MKLPRDLSGRDLTRRLSRLGYALERQRGSHITVRSDGTITHSLTVPDHAPLKIGTLRAILRDVATHHGLTYDEVVLRLFQKK